MMWMALQGVGVAAFLALVLLPTAGFVGLALWLRRHFRYLHRHFDDQEHELRALRDDVRDLGKVEAILERHSRGPELRRRRRPFSVVVPLLATTEGMRRHPGATGAFVAAATAGTAFTLLALDRWETTEDVAPSLPGVPRTIEITEPSTTTNVSSAGEWVAEAATPPGSDIDPAMPSTSVEPMVGGRTIVEGQTTTTTSESGLLADGLTPTTAPLDASTTLEVQLTPEECAEFPAIPSPLVCPAGAP